MAAAVIDCLYRPCGIQMGRVPDTIARRAPPTEPGLGFEGGRYDEHMTARLFSSRIFKIGLLLFLWLVAGATLNVAVAWGACILSPWHHPQYFYESEDAVQNDTTATTLWQQFMPVSCQPNAWRVSAGESLGFSVCVLCGKCACEPRDPNIVNVDAGWPVTCLRGQRWFRHRSLDDWQSVWMLDLTNTLIEPMFVNDGFDCFLPWYPLWPGFAVNTVFYAGVLWVLCCGPFTLRRMIRRRRGQCPACAYPIGQSPVCTECGAAVVHSRMI